MSDELDQRLRGLQAELLRPVSPYLWPWERVPVVPRGYGWRLIAAVEEELSLEDKRRAAAANAI